jgi:hypothetical protein
MVVGAQTQTLVSLRTFASAEADSSRTRAEAVGVGFASSSGMVLIFVHVGCACVEKFPHSYVRCWFCGRLIPLFLRAAA